MTLPTCLLATFLAASIARAQEPATLTLRDSTLELSAVWEPLTDTTYGFETRYALVRDLAPASTRATYRADAFRPFLPADAVAPGATWSIDVGAALPFLRQFHPGATAELHHDNGMGVSAHGAHACLRALSEAHAEILLRVHADFLLAGDGGPTTSSWFTPGQFRGRMAIDRGTGQVIAFELAVPQQRANVDVNVLDGPGIAADIGRTRIELTGGRFPAIGADAPQVSEREAELTLERQFYPFAAIDWLDLASARAQSLATGKPLHVVALFGSLTDESC